MTLSCAGAGVVIPYVGPLARLLGFTPLPLSFLGIVAVFVLVYLTLAELGKSRFYRLQERSGTPSFARPIPGEHRALQKRASRWSMVDRPRPQA